MLADTSKQLLSSLTEADPSVEKEGEEQGEERVEEEEEEEHLSTKKVKSASKKTPAKI